MALAMPYWSSIIRVRPGVPLDVGNHGVGRRARCRPRADQRRIRLGLFEVPARSFGRNSAELCRSRSCSSSCFRGYYLVDIGDSNLVSINLFDTAEGMQESNKLGPAWAKEAAAERALYSHVPETVPLRGVLLRYCRFSCIFWCW